MEQMRNENGLWGGSRIRQLVNTTGGQYAANSTNLLFSVGLR